MAKDYIPSYFVNQSALMESRRWMIVAIIASIFAVILIFAIIIILPLKTKEIRYVEFTSSRDNFFKVFPADLTKSQKLLISRKILRNYIFDRHVIDNESEHKRFKRVLRYSDKSLHQNIKNEFKKLSSNLSGGIRDIEIIYDIEIGPNSHEIEFKTIDKLSNSSDENLWVVHIKYELNNIIKQEDELFNPLGIKILKYNFTRKKYKGDK